MVTPSKEKNYNNLKKYLHKQEFSRAVIFENTLS